LQRCAALTMADLLAAAQSYLKTSDSQIISTLCPAVSDPLPASLLKAFRQSNEYYGNLLQQMQELHREINHDHGFQLVPPGGPSMISTQTMPSNAEYPHQFLSRSDPTLHAAEDEIDEELVRTLDRDLDLLLLSEDEDVYLASDEEEEDDFASFEALQSSLETLNEDELTGSSASGGGLHFTSTSWTASRGSTGNKMSAVTSGAGAHDEFLDSDGWWISEEYLRDDDPNAVYLGVNEPEFTFRVLEEELSSGPDRIADSDEEGFFSSDYFD